jgi:CBS domain-containing protein
MQEVRVDACNRAAIEANAGFVPVVDDYARVIGVITDRDLVVRLLAEGRHAGTAVGDQPLRDRAIRAAWPRRAAAPGSEPAGIV